MVENLFPLKVENASVVKRGNTLLGPLETTLEASGITIIIGPNGSGKTTFLRLLHGLERCREGFVRWNVDKQEAANRQAFVFQTPIMLRRSVLENLAYPLNVRGTARADAERSAKAAAAEVRLSNSLGRSATALSGGEKQKLALARALVLKPDVLFLDEPTTNLDGRSTREIENLLMHQAQQGLTILMATHDLGQARRLADRVLFFHQGQLIEDKGAPLFFKSPSSSQAKAFLKGDIVE